MPAMYPLNMGHFYFCNILGFCWPISTIFFTITNWNDQNTYHSVARQCVHCCKGDALTHERGHASPQTVNREQARLLQLCAGRSARFIDETTAVSTQFIHTTSVLSQEIRAPNATSPANGNSIGYGFQSVSYNMGCHSVCVVHGWNRLNCCSTLAQVPTICWWLPDLRVFTPWFFNRLRRYISFVLTYLLTY